MRVNYIVKEIPKSDTHDYLKNIHYAKRVPPIQYAYGLFRDEVLVGVVTYAPPASPQVARSLVRAPFEKLVLELNRLCLKDNLKNESSILVGRSLTLLPKAKLIVSYADSAQGHVGYVYQACNFIYIGAYTSHDSEYIIDGVKVHPRSLAARGITAPAAWAKKHGIEICKPQPKYKYVYLVGDKKQKKIMLRLSKISALPYPKEAKSCA